MWDPNYEREGFPLFSVQKVKLTFQITKFIFFKFLYINVNIWKDYVCLSFAFHFLSVPPHFLWTSDLAVTAAAKSLQLCPTLCDPIDGSPLGSPSLGFSRQEHWSELPFPSPQLLLIEGNGNPLQYSCLENPVDRGALWAAVHGVAQIWTRLKQLSIPACIGEGNGNPLQYSCLENPRDRGVWWAVVYGVAQSGTQLKRMATHSSVLGWRIPGTGEPGELPSMRSHRVGHN